MGAMTVGAVLGFILGAASGTHAGAFAGTVLGMSVGLLVFGVGWIRAHGGGAPTIEHHRILCTPNGRAADCELEGDLVTGRWYDVRSCSLLRPANDVYCGKPCLRLIKDSGTRPGRGCDCEG